MDIDYAYIKKLLEEIKQGQSPYIKSGDLFTKHLEEHSKQFVFHWHLIVENGFISTNTSSIYDLKESGLIPSSQNPMHFMVNSKPIRLTTVGIEFLQSLNEPKVLEVIQEKFKNEGLSAVMDISKQLAMKVLNKKLESINI
ncbi:MAG: hypothetical protein ABJN96_02520 [Marinomonas sp.]